MPWTDQQKTTLFEEYWSNSPPKCHNPSCGARITNPMFVELPGDPGDYSLFLECPLGCGQLMRNRAEDPLYPFRQWTAHEIDQVIKDYFRNGIALCPVDDTSLHITDHPQPTETTVKIHCRRCGRSPWKDIPKAMP
jgi:hypothetical protein